MEITTAAPVGKPDVIVRLTAEEARLLRMIFDGLTLGATGEAMSADVNYRMGDDEDGHDLIVGIADTLEDFSY